MTYNQRIIPFIKLPTGYSVKLLNPNNIDIFYNGEWVGTFGFVNSITEFNNKSYIRVLSIHIDENHRRKGIYSAIIDGADNYAKKSNLDGAISHEFYLGERERTNMADAFWNSMVMKSKAEKHIAANGIVFTTKNYEKRNKS